MSEKCKSCLDTPVRYCSTLMSIIIFLAGLASIALVLIFGNIVDSPLEPEPSMTNGTVTSAPAPAVMTPSAAPITGNSTDCGGLSADGGLGVLGFLLINHGVLASVLAAFLTFQTFTSDDEGRALSGDVRKSVAWFLSGTLVLGLGITFWVPNLGGPTHVLAATVYLTLAGFSFMLSCLFFLRKCCGVQGDKKEYNNGAGGFGGV